MRSSARFARRRGASSIPAVAMSEGYLPQFGCVTGSSEGVMGVHFVNGGLVNDGELHVEHPELLVYEPLPNNRFQLVAADYLVTLRGVACDECCASRTDGPALPPV